MTRDELIDRLERLLVLSPNERRLTHALGSCVFVQPHDVLQGLREGQFVLISRGVADLIVAELKGVC
jgi:hypothetical protein